MLSSKVVSKLQQQLAKKPISFSRFNASHNARLIKTQPFAQPIIQTRMNRTVTNPIRDTSYPFDWRRKEYEIPELPAGEEMPLQVESTVLGSDIPYMREHIGKVINFTPDDVTKYFPEGPAGKVLKQLEGFTDGNVGLLIREPTLQTISFLEENKSKGFQTPYLFLDGREGSGKSTTLNQAVHWARSNGWLVLFLNDGAEFINGNFIERSTLFPGMYEQPEFGEALLKGFIAAHGEQAKTLPLRTDFTIEGFERNDTSTLYDLARYGIDYEDSVLSCTAVFHLRRELNLVTEFPVLIAVDGVNYFHKGSRTLHDPLGHTENPYKIRFPRMHGDKLVLANIFRNYKKNDMINGTQIVTMTHYPNYDAKYMQNDELKPDNKYVLNVPSYSKEELSIMGDYYTKVGIVRTELSTRTRDYIFYLNEGLPGSVLSYMKSYN